MKRPLILILAGCFGLLLAGCSAKYYRASADKEVAKIIAEKSPAVPNMDRRFSIEQTNRFSIDELPAATNLVEFLGAESQVEVGARVLSLERALDLAVKFSRAYQMEKEKVYLAALALTFERNLFTPLFAGRAQTAYQVNTEEVRLVVDPLTREPRVLAAEDAKLVEEHRITAQTALGARWLLRSGTLITASATADFLRFITGDPRMAPRSELAARIIQPLWGGRGYKVTMENLTQAEREMLYALRKFTLYRKSFSVQNAMEYYRVLRNRDMALNNWNGYQSAKKNAERTRAFVNEGRTRLGELGRLEQQELASEAQWINAIREYKLALDNFKIDLGLSVQANLILDSGELDRLRIEHPNIDVGDAIQLALTMRLDYQNAKDVLEDSTRKVDVAAEGFKPRLDFVSNIGINSAPKPGRVFAAPDPERYHWDAGLNLDLPFERTAERNLYRTALITAQKAGRDLTLLEDTIKRQVRDNWRVLEKDRRNYEISELTVRATGPVPGSPVTIATPVG